MAITSEDIQNQSFSIGRKGYDVDEVDVFLEHVADEIDLLNDRIAELEDQLAEAEAHEQVVEVERVDAVEVERGGSDVDEGEYAALLAEKDDIIADLEAQLSDKQANDSAISQALIIAQRSADEIIVKANAQASETMQDARDEAERILARANADKQDVVDAIRKLEDDREDARTEYAEMLRDMIDDATSKLNGLGFDDDIDAIPDAGDIGIVYEEDVAVEYETPETVEPSVTAAPVASAYEKDLSGFGDVEDDFEDVD
ncbi:DivIVA domain-containing protein [Adlercreutzia murintestinalis]|uniref:DivIVA domain-containing protein n=1 Tax=Adlercreutzia murintestinalis TaxID=2941325 RepID=UPI0020426954|nr:DivIVA domain-containing protein [Adlercreutzia murintestinalis]